MCSEFASHVSLLGVVRRSAKDELLFAAIPNLEIGPMQICTASFHARCRVDVPIIRHSGDGPVQN